MSVFEHPAYQAEQENLIRTLSVVEKETVLAEDELIDSERELKHARAYDPDKLPVREMLYAKAVSSLRTLGLCAKKPYFTRIDFHEDGGSAESVYIGKYGLTESDSLKTVVVDWRAPLANLYYSGQLGRVNYTAPDGRVEGELTLKRQFEIDEGKLLSIFDTDIVSRDAYLEAALNAMSGERLKEIVTTIQAEQNYVIRYPLKRSLIVAGAAGSGKTTIALHRIAYLLYAFQNQLSAKNMMIIAPNPLFLNYIAGVLPDLGVEEVQQTTFRMLISNWLGKSFAAFDASDRTERMLNAPETELKALSDIAQFKGSLRFMHLIDAFLEAYERDYAPEEGISFGPVELYSKKEIDRFLLEDEKPFPMQRRMAEFKKQLTRRANAAAKQLGAWFTRECDRRAALIRETEHDAESLKTKLRRLYETRDSRISQAQEQVKPFVKKTLDELPTLNPVELYRLFLTQIASSSGDTEKAAAARTLERLDNKRPLEPEDIAPLAYIAMRVLELPRFDIRHIVIDEAQDFNAFEIALIMKMMPSATFTIVGDLMQGIHAWRALTGWKTLSDDLFSGAASMHSLMTSYRNTFEIMNTALRVSAHFPTAGQTEVQPVERHGEAPSYTRFSTKAEQASLISEIVRKRQAQGVSCIAVITRTQSEARALIKRLPEELHAKLLNVDDAEYTADVYVAPASGVKGLEFDCVIMADAGADLFPLRDADAKLLYVCLTRPLHKLDILYHNTLTPLLEA